MLVRAILSRGGRITAGVLALATASLAAASSPAGVGEDPVRYGPRRQDAEIPPGSIVLDVPRRGGTSFAPETDAIVARLDLSVYEGYLQGLSGWTTVVVGGETMRLRTRYSLTPLGRNCWQYAYETLAALGYDVRYQEYSRAGHDLKNVIATIPGETTPDRIYVMGAHIDATSESPTVDAPGAEDNGSGSAALLAAATALVGERFDSTIEIVFFSGEEQGLWGSDAYVDDALAQGRDIRSAVTFDMIAAWNNDYGVLIEGGTAWEPLMFLMADAVDTYTSITRQFSYFSFGSDHVPFQSAGIPAILAIDLDWASYADYHRTTDTYDKTTPALGFEIAHAGVAALVHQAGPLGQAVDVPVATLPRSPGAYPNPAAHQVTVAFLRSAVSPGATSGVVRVFDVAGRQVRSLALGDALARTDDLSLAEVTWDLRDARGARVRPGVYWLRHDGRARKVVVSP